MQHLIRTLTAAMLALGLGAGSAAAQQPRPAPALPTCTALVKDLKDDPSSVKNGAPLRSVDRIVEDYKSTADVRLCTGVAHYTDFTSHITYVTRWDDDRRKSYGVNAHDTTDAETSDRARTLRIKSHPPGSDGSFSLRNYVPYCSDPSFIKIAKNELHLGISFRGAFYREPGFDILDMTANGYGSGILSNCIAKVGDAQENGEIFLGTNWVAGEDERRYEFYVLESGPEGWQLTNRVWEIGTE